MTLNHPDDDIEGISRAVPAAPRGLARDPVIEAKLQRESLGAITSAIAAGVRGDGADIDLPGSSADVLPGQPVPAQMPVPTSLPPVPRVPAPRPSPTSPILVPAGYAGESGRNRRK